MEWLFGRFIPTPTEVAQGTALGALINTMTEEQKEEIIAPLHAIVAMIDTNLDGVIDRKESLAYVGQINNPVVIAEFLRQAPESQRDIYIQFIKNARSGLAGFKEQGIEGAIGLIAGEVFFDRQLYELHRLISDKNISKMIQGVQESVVTMSDGSTQLTPTGEGNLRDIAERIRKLIPKNINFPSAAELAILAEEPSPIPRALEILATPAVPSLPRGPIGLPL